MSLTIAGIGTAVPEHRIAQDEAARWALSLCRDGHDRERLLSTLYRRSGVRFRHSVLLESSNGDSGVWQKFYPPAANESDRGPTTRQRMERYDAEAGSLAARAARRALEDARVLPSEITHLITVSCTGFVAPGVEMALIDALGLCPGVSRTHVGFMGCHGAMNALRVAAAFASADPDARVLVSAVELCSLHQQYGWSADKAVANALFADGAASVVVRPDRVSTGSGLVLRGSASRRLEASKDFMTWKIGDHGFRMTLSAEVPEVIRGNLGEWVSGWLCRQELRIDQIGSWAIHPGGPRILRATAGALGLDDEALGPSRSVLEEFGNMSSPTVLFILERLRRARAPLPWLVLGFGPGLAIEVILLDGVSPGRPASSV